MTCPLCGGLVRGGRHPKDSSIVSAVPQLLNHLKVYHAEEIRKRITRSEALGQGSSE